MILMSIQCCFFHFSMQGRDGVYINEIGQLLPLEQLWLCIQLEPQSSSLESFYQ